MQILTRVGGTKGDWALGDKCPAPSGPALYVKKALTIKTLTTYGYDEKNIINIFLSLWVPDDNHLLHDIVPL